jgi:hypothetical protein
MEILFIEKVKILMLTKWSYSSPDYADSRTWDGDHNLST